MHNNPGRNPNYGGLMSNSVELVLGIFSGPRLVGWPSYSVVQACCWSLHSGIFCPKSAGSLNNSRCPISNLAESRGLQQ